MKQALFFALFFVFFQANAQLTPEPNSTSETWHDKVPVSGEIRTGLMMGEICTDKIKNSFYVKIPDSNNYTFLNVDISSNDGRYVYTARYNIKGQKGIIELIRDTKLAKKLQTYQCNELTILSWLTNGPKDKKEEFVLSGWSSNFKAKNAIVYLNSENPALIYVINNSTKKSETIPCKIIEGESNVAYNCLCELPLQFITEDTDISVVQRVRRSQNRYSMKISN